ncbi:MAG: aminoglycoside phosphotransferase family protein [Alphaproteobacteria bacterium]|nr:aminoglycoside phosphotransferase family protein [Alphaproteobacteria bacterium]
MITNEIPNFLTKKFPKSQIKFIGSGSDSDAYKIESRVIRIPHNNAKDLYLREAAICNAINNQMHFKIPQITIHTEPDGLLWVEHEMIMGHKWSWHKFMWQPMRMKNLGRSLAQFMAELHSINTRLIPEKFQESIPYLRFDDFKPFFKKYLTESQLRVFQKNYERILAYPVKKRDMVLVHLGIKGPNSVVDSDGNLIGVFDFCNAGIYERERDMVLIAMLAPYPLWRTFSYEYQRKTKIKPNKKRIFDLMKIEFLWSKRWTTPNGTIHAPNERFLLKNIGAAMAHFHHLPPVFKWWWYYAAKLRKHV